VLPFDKAWRVHGFHNIEEVFTFLDKETKKGSQLDALSVLKPIRRAVRAFPLAIQRKVKKPATSDPDFRHPEPRSHPVEGATGVF